MPRWLIAATFAALAAFAGMPAAALEVVYVIRHAQKQDPWPTEQDRLRPLNDKGARCAAARADWLDRQGPIAAVYTSERLRTLLTGLEVSRRSNARLVGDDSTTAPGDAWVAELKERHMRDRAIVVVGHSNTVDDLVLAFRPGTQGCLRNLALSQPEIPESQYGDLWVVELAGEGCAGLSHEPPLVLGRRDRNNCATQ